MTDSPARYRLDLRDAARQLASVEVELDLAAGGPVDLAMPAWTPGSYKVREFARHVQDFAAQDGEGRPLEWRKLDKQTWRMEVPAGPPARVRARWRVLCDELTVRTSHLDSGHALVNGASVFLYRVGGERLPVELEVVAPPGWRVATGLAAAEGRPGVYLAAGYDELVDHPLEAGPHQAVEFQAAGRAHRLVFCGPGNHDPGALAADVARVVEASAAIFGGLPYRDYTFIVHLVPGGGGGLEHENSACLQFDGFAFHRRKDRERFLSLAAHEHFHTWNVKRVRPRVLGPFDYRREVYTPMLWVCEGWTAYYDELLLLRAGLVDARRYLEGVAEHVESLLRTPGRRRMSLAEASFHAWVKLYLPSPGNLNSAVSYYEKGQLVALLLDLELRRLTGGERSLDDVLRALWDRWRMDGRGYEDGEVRALAEEAAGRDLDGFFGRYVHGTEELDLEGALASFGLRLVDRPERPKEDLRSGRPEAYLGVQVREEAGRAVVSGVAEGSPAWEAGLNPLDEWVALDGVRVGSSTWKDRLRDHAPGDRVRLSLFRRDVLREVELELARAPFQRLRIEPDPAADERARALYRGWLGREWTPPKTEAEGEGEGGA